MKTISTTELAESIDHLARGFAALADYLPARASYRQALAFMLLAQADLAGRKMTVSDLRDAAGDDLNGLPKLGQSIERTYQLFLAPSKQEPNGLGWLKQVPDDDDRRKKHLRLTSEGLAVANHAVAALRQPMET